MHYEQDVNILTGHVVVKGTLCIPFGARGIIVFAHGSGSSRLSLRNKSVSRYLNENKFGTLLFDLLTDDEALRYKQKRFDIEMLTNRLIGATKWLQGFPPARNYPIGYFGSSTGAASALQASVKLQEICAVVSRGGRPDMVMDVLPDVEAPTLLIVGALDTEVLELNRKSLAALRCLKKLEIVEGASHLFEEKGTLEHVQKMAVNWFQKYLVPSVVPF